MAKNNRKHGRNASACKSYAVSHRREHNKLRRLNKRLETHPNDESAKKAAEACRLVIYGH